MWEPVREVVHVVLTPFSEAHLLVMAAFLVCTMGWSSAYCLAEDWSSVHSSPFQGFLMQPVNPALVQTGFSRAI